MAYPTRSIQVLSTGNVEVIKLNDPAESRKLFWRTPDIVVRNDVATNKSVADRKYEVNEALEAYIWGMNKLLHPQMDDATFLRFWKSCYNGYRAFDNGTPWVPRGTIGAEPWKLEDLSCGGITHEAVTGVPYDGKLDVYALDPDNPPPPPRTLADIDMTRNFFATISVWNNNMPGLDPWSQFYGRFIHPFLGEGGVNTVHYVSVQGRGVLKPVGKIQNPFVPANPIITTGVIS